MRRTCDANGNRLSKTLNGTTQAYSVDDGDKLTSVTQGATAVKSYTYDAAGRTKTVASPVGRTTLNYDYEGRVTSISGPGVSNSFTYNGLDTRVGKVEASGAKTFRRDGAEATSSVLSDGAAVYTLGVSQRRSGSTTFDLSDRLGSAVKQTNTSAGTTATRTYDAFGMLVASTGTPQGPFGFAGSSGYQEDSDSGLKLLGHRYYDASTGRFLTRDPAQHGRNWYAYCDANPLRSLDPTGKFAIPFPFPPILPVLVVVAVICVAVVAYEGYEAWKDSHPAPPAPSPNPGPAPAPQPGPRPSPQPGPVVPTPDHLPLPPLRTPDEDDDLDKQCEDGCTLHCYGKEGDEWFACIESCIKDCHDTGGAWPPPPGQ